MIAIGFHHGKLARWTWQNGETLVIDETPEYPGTLASTRQSAGWVGGFGYYSAVWTVAKLDSDQLTKRSWSIIHPVEDVGLYRTASGWGGFDLAEEPGLLLTYHSMDRFAKLWSIAGQEKWCEPLVHAAGIRSGLLSGDCYRVLTASGDPRLRLWAIKEPIVAPLDERLPLPQGEVVTMADIDPTGCRILAASQVDEKGKVRLFELPDPNGVPKLAFEHDTDALVSDLELRNDGGAIAWTDTEGKYTVIDTRTGEELWRHVTQPGGSRTARFVNSSGKLLVTGEEPEFWLLDRAGARKIGLGDQAKGKVRCSAVSEKENLLALGDELGRVWLFGLPGGTLDRTWKAHGETVSGLAFSPDGKHLVSASYDNSARQWNTATGEGLQPMVTEGELLGVAFSGDGKWILTFGRDETARIWDSSTGRPAAPPLRHRGWVERAWFTNDNQRVVTSTLNGALRCWDRATGQPSSDEITFGDDYTGSWLSADGTRWMKIDQAGLLRRGRNGALPDKEFLENILEAAAPFAGKSFNSHGGTEAMEAASEADWQRLKKALKAVP